PGLRGGDRPQSAVKSSVLEIVDWKFLKFSICNAETSKSTTSNISELPSLLGQPCQTSLLCQKFFQRPDRQPPQHLTSANVFPVQNPALPANDGVVVETGMFANSNLAAD